MKTDSEENRISVKGVKMKLFDLLTRILIDDSTRERSQQEGKEIKGFRGFLRVFPGHFHRLTLYNPLGLLAGVAFVASFYNPWWHAKADEGRVVIDAFAFWLRHSVPPIGRVFIIETPFALSVLLLLGVLIYFLIVFWGSTMAGMKGRLYVVAGGLLMLIYTAGFYGTLVYALHRIGGTLSEDFVVYTYGGMRPADVHTYFWPSYYWAIGAGSICLLSSLIHGLLPIRFYRRKKEVEQG